MSEITIRLIYNKQTGKKDIFVDFESEPDALPIEHEQGHRQIVVQLIGKGVLSEGEAGEVVVRRVEPTSRRTGNDTARDTRTADRQTD